MCKSVVTRVLGCFRSYKNTGGAKEDMADGEELQVCKYIKQKYWDGLDSIRKPAVQKKAIANGEGFPVCKSILNNDIRMVQIL